MVCSSAARSALLILSAGLALGACSNPALSVLRAGTVVMPTDPDGIEFGNQTIQEDEFFISAPIGLAIGAALTAPLQAANSEVILPEGTMFELAIVRGAKNPEFDGSSLTFCAVDTGDSIRAYMAGIGLSAEADDTLCLGSTQPETLEFDFAFASEADDADDVQIIEITPVGYEPRQNIPLEGENLARIQYDGPQSYNRDRISFQFQIVRGGNEVPFASASVGDSPMQSVRMEVDLIDLPRTVNMMGASFEVVSFERETETVTVRILKTLPSGRYRVYSPPQPIYIYIPGD